MRRASLIVPLLVLGIAAMATAVPSIFTIDENNYLATVLGLRAGGLGLAPTAGLTPSPELLFFDPWPEGRAVVTTPVTSTAPPLYAPLALPLSYLGWRGLVGLNVVAWLVTTYLVFRITERHAERPEAPWVAAAAFALGGYALEYAQGLWPQMLSAALCTGAFAATSHARREDRLVAGALAGLLVGWATGVRYQNLLVALCLGAALVATSTRRARMGAAYAGGLALPLAVSSLINHARFGSFNPVTKGTTYLGTDEVAASVQSPGQPFEVFWAKVVDFSSHPPIGPVWTPEADTGAYVAFGAVKKAWLQSSPWLALAMVGLALAWWPRARLEDGMRRELRVVSLVFAALLTVFSLQGYGRTDGVGFNQRYFIEMVPLGAIVLGWLVDRSGAPRRGLLLGAGLGGVAATGLMAMSPEASFRHFLLLYAPLGLALGAAVSLAAKPLGEANRVLAAMVGACVAWATVTHVGDDLRASRGLRQYNLARQEMLASTLPERGALFALGHFKDAAGPLLLERDWVVVDPAIDRGRDAPRLVDELLASGRRVFVDVSDLPPPLFHHLRGDHPAAMVAPGSAPIMEIFATDAPPTR